jgi:hypothetical protein
MEPLNWRSCTERLRKICRKVYAGGRSELLIQPSTLSDFSGSGRSHVTHWRIAGPLPLSGGARIILRPHLGQFEYSVAKECPSFGTNGMVRRQDCRCRGWVESGSSRRRTTVLRGCVTPSGGRIASKREPSARAIGPTCRNRSMQLTDRNVICAGFRCGGTCKPGLRELSTEYVGSPDNPATR